MCPSPDVGSTAPDTRQTRQIEAFGRKVTATAGHLMGPLGDGSVSQHYQNALGELHRELRRPGIQRSIFSYAQAPKELVRSKLSVPEIQHRALTYLPEELLHNIPESNNAFSLFQGFQASIPEDEEGQKRKHDRHSPKGIKLLGDAEGNTGGLPALEKLKSDKSSLDHRLEMMGIRKNMCASEIREIDNKITNLNTMRKIVLERLAGLEQEEAELEHNISDVDNKLEILQEELEDAAAMATKSPSFTAKNDAEDDLTTSQVENDSFMSESIYQKLPSPKSRRLKTTRRKSMPILHEHLEPGSQIRELQAHNDMVSAVDFDVPFGTMVTAALDDTVRVWNLNAGRCMGLLEGHLSSVRCLQVEDNIVATGSMDASIRLWDLNRAEYVPRDNRINKETDGEDEGDNL
ncbi:Mitochondrial fission protein, partial [Cryomyces antarcticus]